MLRIDDPTSLSLLFHLNSEPWLNDDAYKSTSAAHDVRHPAHVLAEHTLPAPAPTGLASLLARRRSTRAFSRGTLALDKLSALLAAAYGIVDQAPNGPESPFLRRAVPSAGGLYPLDIYVLCRRTEGLPDGIHRYEALGHGLQQMVAGDPFPGLEPLFYTYDFMREANLVIVLAAVFERTQKKYGPRGYRYILLEAGHVGQNLCLAATELGLAALCMGGFVDSALNALLQLQPRQEGAVYTLAVGLP